VSVQHLEEVALGRYPKVGEHPLLQIRYQGILLLEAAVGKGRSEALTGGEIESRQAEPIDFGFVSVRACQGSVHVGENVDLGCPRVLLVGGEKTFEDRCGRPRLVWVQSYQGRSQ
jgi:hypothetical protein